MFPILALLGAATAVASDTLTYPVINHGRPAGAMQVIRSDDSVVVRYAHIDRNRGRWVESRYRLGADGAVIGGESRPSSRTGIAGDPTDRFAIRGDSLHWRRGRNTGRAAARAGIYPLANSTAFDVARLARLLLERPDLSAPLIPVGNARAEIVAETVLQTAGGARRARLVAMHAGGNVPQAVWLDADGELVSSAVGWFITAHPDAVASLPTLRALEMAWRDGEGNALAAGLAPEARGTVLIRNANVFDAERGVMRPRTSILIDGDRIRAVGPVDSVTAPHGATVIDATDKSVVPGLWDMHTHFQLTSQQNGVVRQLANGITTIRDLAADTDVGLSHRDRANDGTLVAPRVLLGGFIEGPGLWAGPSDVLVRTEQEARDVVARYAALGYRQIKLYNLVHPDLVPTIAEEARRHGLRLSGHIPRGLTVPAALRLGLDEINHAAFLFSTLHQDSLYTPMMRPYSAVAALVAPHTDVHGPEMSALITELIQQRTVIDGTFNLWMRDTTGADSTLARAGNRSYLQLIKRLHDAGVTLVPGTDGSSYNLELETYQRAGIPAPEVLRIATLVSAQVMGDDADYGSISVGKVADLVIVSGRPDQQVSDLRMVDRVVRAGRVYRASELTSALVRAAARP
jgi:imidazolonepropionase-like amidohydrolase